MYSDMSQQSQNTIDQNKIQQFMNKAVGDIAGSSTAMLVIIGERLGLYRLWRKQTTRSQLKNLLIKLEL